MKPSSESGAIAASESACTAKAGGVLDAAAGEEAGHEEPGEQVGVREQEPHRPGAARREQHQRAAHEGGAGDESRPEALPRESSGTVILDALAGALDLDVGHGSFRPGAR